MSSLISNPQKTKRNSLAVSIVIFKPDQDVLYNTLTSLHNSITYAINQGVITATTLYIVDNTPSAEMELSENTKNLLKTWQGDVKALKMHQNLGYGQGHNMAITDMTNKHQYHLILNPDVFLQKDTILQSIDFMNKNSHCACLTPSCCDQKGNKQYLCKAYPSVSTLLIRGFCPACIKKIFYKKLNIYELRDITEDKDTQVTIASGCYMFCRTEALQQVGGFDPNFFLYFEDFDLCLRLARKWTISYVPAVLIVHLGGNAAKKGLRHIFLFLTSAIRFFTKHGWRL